MKFWYFLTGDKKSVNRIEFIFDLMNDDIDKEDKYSTFRFFSIKFKKRNKEAIEECWSEVKKRYQRFEEWYNERDLYHKIGYLVAINFIDINKLYNSSTEKTKSEFKRYLDELMKESVKNISLEELQYSEKENVRKIQRNIS